MIVDLSQFRKLNLNVKNYSQINLAIITYKENFDYDFNENTFIKWCFRGQLLIQKQIKLFVSPLKSVWRNIHFLMF